VASHAVVAGAERTGASPSGGRRQGGRVRRGRARTGHISSGHAVHWVLERKSRTTALAVCDFDRVGDAPQHVGARLHTSTPPAASNDRRAAGRWRAPELRHRPAVCGRRGPFPADRRLRAARSSSSKPTARSSTSSRPNPSSAACRSSRRSDRSRRLRRARGSRWPRHPTPRSRPPVPRRWAAVHRRGDTGISKPMTRRVPRQRGQSSRHDLGTSRSTGCRTAGTQSCRCARTAAAGSRGSRWWWPPSIAGCGWCSSGGWRSPARRRRSDRRRLLHPLQELPGVGRQRLHVAALAFRIHRVEGERGFARIR